MHSLVNILSGKHEKTADKLLPVVKIVRKLFSQPEPRTLLCNT